MNNTTTFEFKITLIDEAARGENGLPVTAKILFYANELETDSVKDEDGNEVALIGEEESEIIDAFVESEEWKVFCYETEPQETRDQDWEDKYVDHSKECYHQDF